MITNSKYSSFKKFTAMLLMLVICCSSLLSIKSSASSGVEDFVTRCYQIALGRQPDSEGLKSWTQKLTEGSACGVSVAYGFVYSPEFQNAGFDNATYVEKMYNMLLGRDSDASGKEYWVNALNNGQSREDIFYGFANSQEFYNLCDSYGIFAGHYLQGIGMERNADINCFVNNFYVICLGRKGDLNGQANWVEQLASGYLTGTVMAYGFIFSGEFIKKETTNAEYVTTLYRTFLSREPDKESLDSWVHELAYGYQSRERVFNGFAMSIEFDSLCASYGIIRG
ncbi:MAG: DUF4214 domain-containing protein, partial [Clostridia bacterium]|nr:DUF4214 domain-containing protein [Clostridia bacterium]